METTTEKPETDKEELDIASLATRDLHQSKEDVRTGVINEDQFLTFMIKTDLYGIDILHVKEILSYTDIAAVPMTPDYIKGVMNLRGSVVPVIDLSWRFNQKPEKKTRLTCVIVIEVEQEVGDPVDIGIVVDSVDKVVGIAKTDMEKSPEFGTKIRPEFIEFMGKVEGSFVPVLNIAQVLNIDELAAFDIAKEKFYNLEKKMKLSNEISTLSEQEKEVNDNVPENSEDIHTQNEN